jgi:hypothetical protein
MSKKLIRRAMPVAIEDLKHWLRTDDKKYQRIKTIIEQLRVNPKVINDLRGIGLPAGLNLSLFYSLNLEGKYYAIRKYRCNVRHLYRHQTFEQASHK